MLESGVPCYGVGEGVGVSSYSLLLLLLLLPPFVSALVMVQISLIALWFEASHGLVVWLKHGITCHNLLFLLLFSLFFYIYTNVDLCGFLSFFFLNFFFYFFKFNGMLVMIIF